jgi:hypothetical protein
MKQNNENAIEGFETISPFTHGMSFVAQNGLISRVEQNCSQNVCTHNKWATKRIREATETKNTTTIEGFGEMPFMTLDVLFSAEKEGNSVRLNDARNNKLTNAEEICKRNMHLMEEYCRSKPGYTSEKTSLSGVSDHFDEDVYDDLQQIPHETFAYDLKERKELKQIRAINRTLIRIVKYGKGNRKSQDPQFIRHIPLLKQRIFKRAFAGGVKV